MTRRRRTRMKTMKKKLGKGAWTRSWRSCQGQASRENIDHADQRGAIKPTNQLGAPGMQTTACRAHHAEHPLATRRIAYFFKFTQIQSARAAYLKPTVPGSCMQL
mmetsp:Transcript_12130/g.23358  ORF Transcript_12130/g.23358 Transcript_12130/m.23358 type:complete len:105 (+) Transcript_12130:915-1229(+)